MGNSLANHILNVSLVLRRSQRALKGFNLWNDKVRSLFRKFSPTSPSLWPWCGITE